jgi:hypothetical protein
MENQLPKIVHGYRLFKGKFKDEEPNLQRTKLETLGSSSSQIGKLDRVGTGMLRLKLGALVSEVNWICSSGIISVV